MQTVCDRILESLKNIDSSLGDIRFNSATFSPESNEVNVKFVSDTVASKESVDFIVDKISKQLPPKLTVNVKVAKSIVDATSAKMAIIKFFGETNHYVAHAVNEETVKIICAGKITKYDVCVTSDVADYLYRTSALDKLDEKLGREFSSNFSGSVRIVEATEEEPTFEISSVSISDVETEKVRRLKVVCSTKFCDTEEYDTASYIEDAVDELGEVYFAGYVQSVEKRESKNGRPYYLISLNDKTGTVTGRFFTGDKNKIKKLEKISEGSTIIMRGVNELFNEKASLLIKGFNLCMMPDNYTPDEKPGKPVPREYTLVFPKPAEVVKQANIFNYADETPSCLIGKEFTVVDIETTGTDASNDKITEIGAVKIKDGEVVSSFQTLIYPEVSIPKKIVELTGIDDDMVAESPLISEVYPDFYKYVSGTTFIAHNSEFDFKFLRNAGKKLGYNLTLDVIDSIAVAKKAVPGMKNYKLNTLCEKFKIEFRHHRALSDAFATAELFLELVKIKNSY